MAGHERWLRRFTLIGLIQLVGVALTLIAIRGLIGAAVAPAVSVVRNVKGFPPAWLLISKQVPAPFVRVDEKQRQTI